MAQDASDGSASVPIKDSSSDVSITMRALAPAATGACQRGQALHDCGEQLRFSTVDAGVLGFQAYTEIIQIMSESFD
jgi:hypothetical protein